jgi:hypothetical protein
VAHSTPTDQKPRIAPIFVYPFAGTRHVGHGRIRETNLGPERCLGRTVLPLGNVAAREQVRLLQLL